MRLIYITSLLMIAVSLSACADKNDMIKDGNDGVDLAEFKWKNRVILCYPKDDDAWAGQAKLLEKNRAQIKDRDLVVIRVDKLMKKDLNGLKFNEAQRIAVIRKYKLTPSSSLLIGKDGDVKRRQAGQLSLLPLFELIDQMPMRRAEMRTE